MDPKSIQNHRRFDVQMIHFEPDLHIASLRNRSKSDTLNEKFSFRYPISMALASAADPKSIQNHRRLDVKMIPSEPDLHVASRHMWPKRKFFVQAPR